MFTSSGTRNPYSITNIRGLVESSMIEFFVSDTKFFHNMTINVDNLRTLFSDHSDVHATYLDDNWEFTLATPKQILIVCSRDFIEDDDQETSEFSETFNVRGDTYELRCLFAVPK